MSCYRNLDKIKIKNYISNTKKAISKKLDDFCLLMEFIFKICKH